MMFIIAISSLFFSSITIGVSGNLLPANTDGLKKQFENGLKSFNDISSLHYSISGLKEFSVQSSDSLCSEIKRLTDKTNIESIYHGTEAAKALNNCQFSAEEFRSTISSVLQSDKSNTGDIYHGVRSSLNLGLPVDESAIEKRLNQLAKSDDSVLSQGYGLLTGGELSQPIAKYYADSVNDLVQQADEIDGRVLQYEGGVGNTALIVNAFYEVSQKANVPLKIDPKQLIKFAAYFSTKRHVATLRSAFYLIKVFKHFSDSKNSIPVVVNRVSSSSVNAKNPSVLISVTDFLGQSLGQISVLAESAKRKEDGAVVISKQKFSPKSSDSTIHELSFYNSKIPRGFYTVHLTLTSNSENKLIGLTENTIEVKVTSEVNVENAELIVADRDTGAQAKSHKLNYPNVFTEKLELDYHQKFSVKFQVKDKQLDETVRVQQAFLRFTNKKSNKEIIYLAEPTTDGNFVYKADVDLTSNAADFRYQSGGYELVLIVGDALLENSLTWKINDPIQLTFHDDSQSDRDHSELYRPKKEIIHQFREEEKRPPAIVSMVFSGLTLFPLLVLLILWLKIGFNLSNMPFGLSPLVFHVSHAAVFGLMFCYWKYLNMFQTVKYLGLLAIPLFVFGHRVLATLAARREKKV